MKYRAKTYYYGAYTKNGANYLITPGDIVYKIKETLWDALKGRNMFMVQPSMEEVDIPINDFGKYFERIC